MIRLLASFSLHESDLTLTIDGVPQEDLHSHYTESCSFRIDDTDLLDHLGVPIAEENLSVSAGYWFMIAPLSVGEHMIHFTASVDNPFFGQFEVDVTYNITVAAP